MNRLVEPDIRRSIPADTGETRRVVLDAFSREAEAELVAAIHKSSRKQPVTRRPQFVL